MVYTRRLQIQTYDKVFQILSDINESLPKCIVLLICYHAIFKHFKQFKFRTIISLGACMLLKKENRYYLFACIIIMKMHVHVFKKE